MPGDITARIELVTAVQALIRITGRMPVQPHDRGVIMAARY
jgi:hypothetical protein